MVEKLNGYVLYRFVYTKIILSFFLYMIYERQSISLE